MSFDREALLSAKGSGTPDEGEHWLVAADWFLSGGETALAASALDRAYGLLPDRSELARQRRGVLDELSIEEHGLVFRYVPAGTFLMGSSTGDPDERPVHARRVEPFWIAEVPMSWSAYCALAGYSQPPQGWPGNADPSMVDPREDRMRAFHLHEDNKIRLQYCESETTAAGDWHSHTGDTRFGSPPRANPSRVVVYDRKPMVAVSAVDAEEVAARMSSETVLYRLPFEAEWEKAARGGLIGAAWSWGDAPPTRERCDFDRFGAFHLLDPRSLPPNGYGLYGMCGGVAEWTGDRYDALAYHRVSVKGETVEPPERTDARVLRGGSWSDCAEAITVSFRSARVTSDWRQANVVGHAPAPNIGFRLVRVSRERP